MYKSCPLGDQMHPLWCDVRLDSDELLAYGLVAQLLVIEHLEKPDLLLVSVEEAGVSDSPTVCVESSRGDTELPECRVVAAAARAPGLETICGREPQILRVLSRGRGQRR